MDLAFEKRTDERLANDLDSLAKRYDRRDEAASLDILATLNALQAAECLADLPRAYRPYQLDGAFEGSFAIAVNTTHRLVFRPNHEGDESFRIEDHKTITAIIICDVYKDYH